MRDGSYSLTVGKTYPVLSVEFYDHAKSLFSQAIGEFCLYRIKDDDGLIKPFPSGLFATVSGEIPADWVFYRNTDHSISLLPQAWAYPSFWGDFYNDEQAAMDAVRKVIMDMGS